MTALEERPTIPAVAHPTACPPWCKHRRQPADHHSGPTATWHWSRQHQVPHPRPLPTDSPVMLRAELMRDDEDGATGETILYIQAEGEVDLRADGADIWIAHLQAWLDTVRVLRRQMR